MSEGMLAGKIAVVTGAAGGLGSTIVKILIDRGAVPVLLDVDAKELTRATRSSESASGRQLLAIVTDVADPASVADAAAEVDRTHGRCDVLVNNAGVLIRSPLLDHATELWDRIINVNLRGYFLCTQAFGRLMLRNGGGAIINVSSLAGEAASFANGAYCASKAGVLALTRSTALEWGTRGVRANAVSPAYMATPMTATMSSDEARARTRNAPLRRFAQTRDVAQTIAFLAGPEASYLSGINIPVDGALSSARAGGWAGPPPQ